MNPTRRILPPADNNEILRRLGFVFINENGDLQPGSPGGPLQAKTVGSVYRHAATGPTPTPAHLLAPADDTRIGGYISNLDNNLTIWWGSDPNVTDQTGATLLPLQSAPANVRGPIYIYATSGAPIAEFVPVYP